MINKVYDKIKKYIKENKLFFITILTIIVLAYIRFPYFINAPGGLVKLDNKVVIKDEYKSKGSFNMAYVTEYRANIFMLLYAKLNPNVDIYKQEEYLAEDEPIEHMLLRDKLQMKEAVDNAIILGYTKANKKVNITKTNIYVTFVIKEAATDLQFNDKILKVDNIEIHNREELDNIILKKDVGEKFNLEVENDGKTYTRYASLTDFDGIRKIGVVLTEDKQYEVEPSVEFKFKSNESGPSGGLMTTLEIYNELISDDLTHGKKIAGTGTIDRYGIVGSIGGVKYKLKGAVNKKAVIFLVPAGENYEEAIKLQKENNYNIKIVSIGTLDEAITYLNNLDK